MNGIHKECNFIFRKNTNRLKKVFEVLHIFTSLIYLGYTFFGLSTMDTELIVILKIFYIKMIHQHCQKAVMQLIEKRVTIKIFLVQQVLLLIHFGS